MALNYLTPDEIADQYLVYLKGLKPEVNTAQTDSDWWIRSRVLGGVISGAYADQRKIADDAFPRSARREALEKHLQLYFGSGFTQATVAEGYALVTAAATGTPLAVGTQLQYEPTGNIYAVKTAFNFPTGVTGVVPVQSIATGQAQNLLAGAPLIFPSPPAGIIPQASVSRNISDGRDIETNPQAAARIETQVQTPLAGGKVADYVRFALDADPSVVSASLIRYAFGFGTVAVIITAGTTDIDAAIDAGQDVVLTPSPELVADVQFYINTQNPETDCATVLAAVPTTLDVTVKVSFVTGNGSTVLSGQTLTQAQLVQREIKRAIYKTPPGGRKIGASGYVVCADIEEVLDFNLSSTPYTIGEKAQILADRQVSNLSPSSVNRALLGNEVAVPGTITVIEM